MNSVLESLVAGYLCLALQEALKKTHSINLKGDAVFVACKSPGVLDFKGIVRPFELGDETRLIRSTVTGKFFFKF
jgi:hypothetical protein